MNFRTTAPIQTQSLQVGAVADDRVEPLVTQPHALQVEDTVPASLQKLQG